MSKRRLNKLCLLLSPHSRDGLFVSLPGGHPVRVGPEHPGEVPVVEAAKELLEEELVDRVAHDDVQGAEAVAVEVVAIAQLERIRQNLNLLLSVFRFFSSFLKAASCNYFI